MPDMRPMCRVTRKVEAKMVWKYKRSTFLTILYRSDDPNTTNMDISTGHMVLAYMEDHLKNKQRLEQEWVALCSYETDPSSTNVAFKVIKTITSIVFVNNRLLHLHAVNTHDKTGYEGNTLLMFLSTTTWGLYVMLWPVRKRASYDFVDNHLAPLRSVVTSEKPSQWR